MKTTTFALAAAALCGLACTSAYDRTYERETRRLESQRRARELSEAAMRDEARKYAAVVYFDVGSSRIPEEGYRELFWYADRIRGFPQAFIDVKGFADSTGHEQLNQQLSEQRAQAVADFLVQQGIPRDRIAPAGFASNFPQEDNESEDGRRRNRRVEVRVR